MTAPTLSTTRPEAESQRCHSDIPIVAAAPGKAASGETTDAGMGPGSRSRTCIADGCDRQWHGRRLCRAHYHRARRAGQLPPPLPHPSWKPPANAYVAKQDVDELAVAFVVEDGVHLHLRITERAVAILRLTQRGLSPREIADRLGVNERTVHRWRRRREEVPA